MTVLAAYPDAASARDAFVLARRGPRPAHDPWRHQGLVVEPERQADGQVRDAATVFLTGRECPWRCVMCDLWQHTTPRDTRRGALVQQIDEAVSALRGGATWPAVLKLYNAGSFFDPRAVPVDDHAAIALRLQPFERVVVESHPSLVAARLPAFLETLRAVAGTRAPACEVAMGLETAHPEALTRLHKRFTLDQFAHAAAHVRDSGAALRVFLLVGVPFIPAASQGDWVRRSVETAFTCGATIVSLIPTRPGNGALETLQSLGAFEPPTIDMLEDALDAAIPIGRTLTTTGGEDHRVCADLWDIECLLPCRHCAAARRARLSAMNLEQRVLPRVACGACDGRPRVSA